MPIGAIGSNSGSSVDALLAEVEQSLAQEQTADIGTAKEQMRTQQELQKQMRDEMKKVRAEIERLQQELKNLKPSFWDFIGLGSTKKKAKRLQGAVGEQSSSLKKMEAKAQSTEKRINEQLAKMREALESQGQRRDSVETVMKQNGEAFASTLRG